MKQLVLFIIAVLAVSAQAETDLEARVAELEERVAHLEAMLSIPAPPPTTHTVDGFTVARLDVRQASSTYAEVVGEVTATEAYERVTFRVTLYGSDGSILGTDTFSVERVSPTPRTFDTLLRNVSAADAVSIGLEVEDTR